MATGGPGSTDPRVVGVIAGVIVVLVAVIAVALLTGDRDDSEELGVDGQLTATPLATATAADATEVPAPASEATESAQPAATAPAGEGPASAAPTDTEPPQPPEPNGPREPTDADAADFVSRLAPEQEAQAEVVLADVNTDGTNEVVVATLLGGRARLDVAGWNGTTYALTFSAEGGSADAIDSVRLTDLDGDPGALEIVLRHTSGNQGESVSLWGTRDGQIVPLTAVDGCWDGSNTYGITGVTVADQQITATCDGSPAPTAAWPSDVYRWDPELLAFAYERTVE